MRPLFFHLYTRIWLAFFAVIVIMLLLLAGVWVYKEVHEAERSQDRILIVRNAEGEALFSAPVVPMMGSPRHGMIFEAQLAEPTQLGDLVYIQLPPMPPPVRAGWFAGAWDNPARFVLWFLLFIGLAVAVATYPLIRRLTKRLEVLQKDVALWGAGNLSKRVAVQGHDEVAALAQRFNEAAAKVEGLVQSHKSLLANASHELRSPLARIKMGLELSPDLAHSPMRGEIELNMRELDQLIDEILLASRLDTEGSASSFVADDFESLDFTALVAEEIALGFPALDIEFNASGQDLQVKGSAKLLRRLVRNLLQNAARYGGGKVQVNLHAEETADEIADATAAAPTAAKGSKNKKVLLQVMDTGPGVPSHLRSRIFEPFYRLPGASEHQGGVGLGLALVASIAKHHQGRVACVSRPDGLSGACFELSLERVD